MTSIYKSAEGEGEVRQRYTALLRRWPVPNEQLRVPTRQGETFVVVSGPAGAPPLILLHGAVANSAMWMGDIPDWAQPFRVYAVDLIGEPGLSAQSRPPLDSDAHAQWLDDVMQGLALKRACFVGVSLGGWLALDFAIRRTERVESLVVLCPGGIGKQRVGFAFRILPLMLLGRWGRRKARELVLGRTPPNASPAMERAAEYFRLLQENTRPRRVKLPIFSDEALKRLQMPLLAIVGGKDLILDSAGTRDRLKRNVPQAEVHYIREAGHFIPGQTATILKFLNQAVFPRLTGSVRSGS